MDKKVGILTFHYADNHGAVLQAYALRRVINSFPDCCGEIINYVPRGYQYSAFSDPAMKDRLKRKREKFKEFLIEECGIHAPMIHSVVGNHYDVYLAGSDQIWNTDILEAKADYEYFFPHLDEDAVRIAYSASIGLDFERIDRKLFHKYLSKFKNISLREKSYVEIITKLSGKNCCGTLDPTMLLREQDYEPLIEKGDTTEEPYILYFWYDLGDGGLKGVETVNILARKYDCSIKHTFLSEESIARKLMVKDSGCILQDSIGEFLWHVKNARAVVTNSFHGAVFSILFQKPFYIYYPQMRRCRQENLVDLFKLQDRVIQGYMSSDKLNLNMDYTSIFSILEQEKERSVAYLKDAIQMA